MAVETVDALAELTSPATNDELGIWDLSAGQFKKIQVANLLGAMITGGGTIALGGFTLTVPATGMAALANVGSWTPAIKFGGANVGITYYAAVGTYIRIGIGSVYFVIATFSISVSNKGSSTGVATLDGLPYAVSNVANLVQPVSLIAENFSITAGNRVVAIGTLNVAELKIYQESISGVLSQLNNTHFNNNGSLYGSIAYLSA